jgi:hypothetical protein
LRIGVSLGLVNEWSEDVSDEYQWRQLGSAVNAVLMQVKKKAMRSGYLSKAALSVPAEDGAKPPLLPIALHQPLNHSGRADIGATRILTEPVEFRDETQLELSFGVKQSPKRKAGRSSRIARL